MKTFISDENIFNTWKGFYTKKAIKGFFCTTGLQNKKKHTLKNIKTLSMIWVPVEQKEEPELMLWSPNIVPLLQDIDENDIGILLVKNEKGLLSSFTLGQKRFVNQTGIMKLTDEDIKRIIDFFMEYKIEEYEDLEENESFDQYVVVPPLVLQELVASYELDCGNKMLTYQELKTQKETPKKVSHILAENSGFDFFRGNKENIWNKTETMPFLKREFMIFNNSPIPAPDSIMHMYLLEEVAEPDGVIGFNVKGLILNNYIIMLKKDYIANSSIMIKLVDKVISENVDIIMDVMSLDIEQRDCVKQGVICEVAQKIMTYLDKYYDDNYILVGDLKERIFPLMSLLDVDESFFDRDEDDEDNEIGNIKDEIINPADLKKINKTVNEIQEKKLEKEAEKKAKQEGNERINILLSPIVSPNDKSVLPWAFLSKPIDLRYIPKNVTPDNVYNALIEEFPYMLEQSLYIAQRVAICKKYNVPFHFPGILLDGAPGIGKTRWAKRVASLCSTGFSFHSLSGIHSSMGIVGSDRGWSEARPGIWALSIQETNTANPVVVMDELDKMGDGKHNGSPQDALLPLLEKETSGKYKDIFLMTSVNLSYFSYIFTSNEINLISEPLQSRLKLFKCRKPTQKEINQIFPNIAKEMLSSMDIPESDFNLSLLDKVRDEYSEHFSIRVLKARIETTIMNTIFFKDNINSDGDKFEARRIGFNR